MTEESIPKLEKNTTTTTVTTVEKTRETREFILIGDVEEKTIKDIMMSILEINRKDRELEKGDKEYVAEPIILNVQTFGGYIYDGFALAGVMDSSITPVHTYCYGKAMSMGFLIFAVGHKRFAHPMANFMYHDGATGGYDKYEGLKQTVEQGRELTKMIDSYIVKYTKITQERLDEVKSYKQDWHFFAEEGKKLGLVDEIIKSQRKG